MSEVGEDALATAVNVQSAAIRCGAINSTGCRPVGGRPFMIPFQQIIFAAADLMAVSVHAFVSNMVDLDTVHEYSVGGATELCGAPTGPTRMITTIIMGCL